MAQMLDCLVNYFGLDENEQPGLRRYFAYHILAGPGPTSKSGVAWIVTLAVHDEAERCSYCQNVHKAETGGPAAAINMAIRYLDSYHANGHLRKIQSAIRGLHGDRFAEPVSNGAMSKRWPTLPARLVHFTQ
jgi:hypothetical protein